MSNHLHLQAALAATKARHFARSGFEAAARGLWLDAVRLELGAIAETTSPEERARLRRSAAMFAMRAGDPALAGSILRRTEAAWVEGRSRDSQPS